MEIILNYFDKGGIVFFALGFLSIYSIAIIIYKFLDIYFFNDLNLKRFLKDSSEVGSLENIENLIADNMDKNNSTLDEIKYLLEGLKKSPKKERPKKEKRPSSIFTGYEKGKRAKKFYRWVNQ